MAESEVEEPGENGESEHGGAVSLEEHADAAIDAALEAHDPFPSTAEDEEEGEDDGEGADAGEGEGARARSGEGEDPDQDEADEDVDEGEDESEESLDTERDLEDLAIHKAYTTLHAQGVPAKVLKHTPKATLIAWAKRVEAQTSAGAAERAAVGDDTRTGAKPGSAKAEPDAYPDWAASRKGIAEQLGVEEASVEPFKYLHDSNAALRQSLDEMRGQLVIDTNVRRLERKFPRLAEKPELVEKLVAKAHELRGKRHYESGIDLFDDAARLIKLDRDLAAARRNGASTPPRLQGGYGAPAQDFDEDFQRRMDLVEAGKFELARSLPPPVQAKRPGKRRSPIG